MEAVVNHDDLGNYSHAEVRALREQISTLQTQLAAEKERADYAWRNTNIIEKARQEEMAKRDAAEAEATALKSTIINLLEILRQWEPDWSSGKDRRTIVMAKYQVGILTDPTKKMENDDARKT